MHVETGHAGEWLVLLPQMGFSVEHTQRNCICIAGDRLLKRYVVAMPDLEEQQLSSQDDALILASDGLWDVLSNEDAAGIIRDIKVSPQFPLLHSPVQQPASCNLVGCAGIHVTVQTLHLQHGCGLLQRFTLCIRVRKLVLFLHVDLLQADCIRKATMQTQQYYDRLLYTITLAQYTVLAKYPVT